MFFVIRAPREEISTRWFVGGCKGSEGVKRDEWYERVAGVASGSGRGEAVGGGLV